MAQKNVPVNVSRELAPLKHERKNGSMRKLPPNTAIQRRPLDHPAVASPYAGSNVQKVVYVSRRTPVMSAVKRVKKFLQHIENRATQGVDMLDTNNQNALNQLAETSEKLHKSAEEVLVKASGKAMEQALRVAEWFRTREDEMLCNVEVRTGSVAAVDDIVETKNDSEDDDTAMEAYLDEEEQQHSNVKGNDSSPDLPEPPLDTASVDQVAPTQMHDTGSEHNEAQETTKTKRRRKRKRKAYDEDDLPEARLRWIKTVEIAISLRA